MTSPLVELRADDGRNLSIPVVRSGSTLFQSCQEECESAALQSNGIERLPH